MNQPQDELDPPFEIIEPEHWRGAGAVQLAAFRPGLSARVPAKLAARPADPAPLRGQLRRRPRARRRGARLSADAGAFPALLRRRQPRALRARPAHVRGPAALVRQHPFDAGRRRPRHRRARGRRRPGNLRPAHLGGRCAAPHREALQALSPGAAPAVHPRAPRVRRGDAGRLPFDAVVDRAARTTARAPTWCWATATARAASAWCRR